MARLTHEQPPNLSPAPPNMATKEAAASGGRPASGHLLHVIHLPPLSVRQLPRGGRRLQFSDGQCPWTLSASDQGHCAVLVFLGDKMRRLFGSVVVVFAAIHFAQGCRSSPDADRLPLHGQRVSNYRAGAAMWPPGIIRIGRDLPSNILNTSITVY